MKTACHTTVHNQNSEAKCIDWASPSPVGRLWLVACEPRDAQSLHRVVFDWQRVVVIDGADGRMKFAAGDLVAFHRGDRLQILMVAEKAPCTAGAAAARGLAADILATAALQPPEEVAQELLVVRLWGSARGGGASDLGEGSLARSLALLQRSNPRANPHLLRRAADEVLRSLKAGAPDALKGLLHRVRGRALLDIASRAVEGTGAIAPLVASAYRHAEADYRAAQLVSMADRCRAEGVRAEEQINAMNAPLFPGLPSGVSPARSPARAGFRAYRCLAIPFGSALPSEGLATVRLFPVGLLTAATPTLQKALARTRSSSATPVVTARKIPGDGKRLTVTLTIREEHQALLGCPTHGGHDVNFITSVRLAGDRYWSRHRHLRIGEPAEFRLESSKSLGARARIEVAIGGQTEEIDVRVEYGKDASDSGPIAVDT